MSVANWAPSTSKVSSDAQQPARSISNRFSSLLSPKSSHTNNFYIDLDEPIKTYGAGDAVKGKVILDITRPLGVTHIVVGLHGYVQVFKNHAKSKSANPNPGSRAATGRGKRWVSEYYGDGYMSLFEEEIVLCGEGRLDPSYSPFHFQFNLEFPYELALPSSIDFERGTITYVITATMTRPAYTAPTMSCNSKVVFLEDIDIAMLPSSKPQEAAPHPEHRSGSPRSSLKRFASYDVKRSRRTSSSSTILQPNKSTFGSAQSNTETLSVREATGSISSTRSSSSGQKVVSAAPSEPRSSRTCPSFDSESRGPTPQIAASAQLCRSGCLPGQLVPLLIKISHNKIVHNPAGIIVTLYRQARVDMHPHLPLASSDSGTRARYEDYYPRSRTGLGGLSLSAAGSSQVWRKDLSQTTAPLYIDPGTMSQEIKVGVRVPELPGAFPSIRNVPGQMINFRYVVEVIIDIYGKLIGRDWVLSGTGATPDVHQSYYFSSSSAASEAGDRTQMTAHESRCIDTTQLRRDKHAITVECELIVGTRDSQKSKGKQKESRPDLEANSEPNETFGSVTAFSSDHETVQQNSPFPARNQSRSDEDYEWISKWDQHGQRWLYIDDWGNVYDDDWNFLGYDYSTEVEQESTSHHNNFATQIPPPQFAEELEVPEKERLRRAEESLLPSQPPAEAEWSSLVVDDAPTAPNFAERSDLYATQDHPAGSGLEQSSSMVQDVAPNQAALPATLPVLSYDGQGSSRGAIAEASSTRPETDDKEELERQRLQAQASKPVDVSSQMTSLLDSGASLARVEEDMSPTAPILQEDHQAEVRSLGVEAGHGEDLPQYQR